MHAICTFIKKKLESNGLVHTSGVVSLKARYKHWWMGYIILSDFFDTDSIMRNIIQYHTHFTIISLLSFLTYAVHTFFSMDFVKGTDIFDKNGVNFIKYKIKW